MASAFTFCGFTVQAGYGLKSEQVHLDGPYYFEIAQGDREALRGLVVEIVRDAMHFHDDTLDYLFGAIPGLNKEDLSIEGTVVIEDQEGNPAELPTSVSDSEAN